MEINPNQHELIQELIELEDKEDFFTKKIAEISTQIAQISPEQADQKKDFQGKVDFFNQKLIETKNKIITISPKINKEQYDFIKNIKTIIKQKPNVNLTESQRNNLFKQIVHIALKGTSDPLLTPWQNMFSLQETLHHALVKSDAIHSFLSDFAQARSSLPGATTPEEQRGLLRLHQFRNRLVEYESEDLDLDTRVKKMKEDIKAFVKETSSSRALTLEDGSKSITFPGGWLNETGGHYVTWEMRKNKETPPVYEFIMYNRGERSTDEELNELFHGKLSYSMGNKTYQRNRTVIRVPEEALNDEDFIKGLAMGYAGHSQYDSANKVYQFLKSYLIDKHKGKVQVSEQEKYILRLIDLAKKPGLTQQQQDQIKEKIHFLIKSDPNLSSIQLFDTCTESNLTLYEKQIAPRTTLRSDKRRVIDSLTHRLSAFTFGKANLSTSSCEDAIIKFERRIILSDHQIRLLNRAKKVLQNLRNIQPVYRANEARLEKLHDDYFVEEILPVPEKLQNLKIEMEKVKNLIKISLVSINLNMKEIHHLQQALFETVKGSDERKLLEEILKHLLIDFEAISTLKVHLVKKSESLKEKEKAPPKEKVFNAKEIDDFIATIDDIYD